MVTKLRCWLIRLQLRWLHRRIHRLADFRDDAELRLAVVESQVGKQNVTSEIRDIEAEAMKLLLHCDKLAKHHVFLQYGATVHDGT